MLVTSLHLHLLRRTYLFLYVKVAKVNVYCIYTLDVVAVIALCKLLEIKVCRVQWCSGAVVALCLNWPVVFFCLSQIRENIA